MATPTTGTLWQAIRAAELTEETLHRRARFVIIAPVGRVAGPLLHCHLDRDDGGFHPLHHVGETLSGAGYDVISLGMRRAAKDINATGRRADAVNRDPETSYDRGH